MPSIETAGAVLTVDLDAVAANWRLLAARAAGADCAAVVKADAYGLGAAEIAPALARAGCENFFVAHVEEGVALRAALGSEAAIHVLNGVTSAETRDCRAAGLVPVLDSLWQVAAWRSAAAAAGEMLPAALQIDTGMARLGLPPAEARRLADDRGLLAGLDLRLAISHLACAEDTDNPANAAQLASFGRLRALFPPARASIASSSGIFLGPAFHLDMVRPGAALYGINPTPGAPNPMLPVVRLSARVAQTRAIGPGDGVGYGHDFVADRPMRLATLGLGYADGWRRGTACGAVWKGRPLPRVGRVSMDSLTVDISALPEEELRPGDFVDLIGPGQDIDAVAAAAGTIGYEILTGLGRRFHRRFLGG